MKKRYRKLRVSTRFLVKIRDIAPLIIKEKRREFISKFGRNNWLEIIVSYGGGFPMGFWLESKNIPYIADFGHIVATGYHSGRTEMPKDGKIISEKEFLEWR